MRVDDAARKTVVFIGSETSGGFVPMGTGFLAAAQHNGHRFHFVVTANHLLDLIKSDKIAVRLNRLTGEAATVLLDKSAKISGLSSSDDLALFNVPYWNDVYDYRVVLLDRDEYEKIKRDIWEPELGDEIVTIGLYTSHHGLTKNIPVVRIGHLAMMPDEPVLTQNREYLNAYLVEVRSIGGLSGSPVFINMPQTRVVDGKMETRSGLGVVLIGMMLGYHLVQSADDQIVVPQYQGNEPHSEFSLDERNTGFAVVLPLERIFDLVESEEMRKAMQAAV